MKAIDAKLNIVDFSTALADGLDTSLPQLHRLQRELATLKRRHALLETLVDSLTLGVALADGDGRLHYRNRAAREILARRDGLCERDGVLLTRSSAATRALAQSFAAIASGASDSDALSVAREGGEAYTLLLTPQRNQRASRGDRENIDVIAGPWNFLAGALDVEPTRSMVLVLIRDPQRKAAGNFAGIRQHFSLTASEATLLEALTFGERLNDFCRRRGISPNTGKFHLRALFAKTGTHRQADLVCRTVSLLASFAPIGG